MKLVVLDYRNASVHFHTIHKDIEINEEFIDSLGYHLSECEWMFAEDIEIIKHKGVITK